MDTKSTYKNLFKFLSILLLAVLLLPVAGHTTTGKVTGQITDPYGNAVFGATVIIRNDSTIYKGTATDTAGNFYLQIPPNPPGQLALYISAIGYEKTIVPLTGNSEKIILNVVLLPKLLDMGTMRVVPTDNTSHKKTTYNKVSIQKAAQTSLVQTNPVSAIKQPHVTREGSSHSSKLRINGTSPKYSINGIEIGYNPNHYGVFTVIPAPVIKEMQFYSQGTPASFQQSSAVLFETGKPFNQSLKGEFNLSLIEATGSWSVGNSKFFALGSLRKSVLDKLVNQFDIKSGRRTIPPTNFQDIFLSTGVKLSPRHYLMIDQYHVRDFLAYNTGSTKANPEGIDTYLHTEEHFVGVRYDAVYDRLLLQARGAVRTGREEYRALPPTTNKSLGTHLNLKTYHWITQGSVQADILLGNSQLSLGGQVENTSRREIELTQRNWNFLPPDANSDNPFTYQPELNVLYGTYSGNRPQVTSALFASYEYHIGAVRLQSGTRLEQFGVLENGSALLVRQKATIPIDETNRVSFFYGTFAENQTNRILEPYQVLIQADLDKLKPIHTKLLSAQYATEAFTFGIFSKSITNLPVVTPQFSYVNPDGTVSDGFLVTQSSGSTSFIGGDISFSKKNLLSGRLDIYSFYGYTHAVKTTNGVKVPYELSATHQFLTQGTYRVNKLLSLGAELGIRSGFNYTPFPDNSTFYGENRYSEEYYTESLARENSARFPVNGMLNIKAMFNFGDTKVFLSISNITNHANPIINTIDGYIYDTGILPSVGLTRHF